MNLHPEPSRELALRQSSLSGKGVFAVRAFKEGEIVVPWILERTGKVDDFSEKEKEYVSQNDDGDYVLFASPARYVNHSCDPNTVAKDGANVALRDIKEGEEITTDYCLEGALNKFECNCGSSNCRGKINL